MVNTPVKNGLILGLIMCIVSMAMAFISPKAYVLYGRTALLIAVAYFMYKIGKDEKILNEGVLTFGEAFKAIFIGSIIGYLVFNAFEFVLFNFIKTDLNVIANDAAIETAEKAIDWISGIADTDEEAMERAKEEIANELTRDKTDKNIGNTMMALMINLIFPCLVGGLFMALFTKSKNA